MIEKIKKMYYEENKSMGEIAKTLDKSLNFVKYHMDKNSLKRRPHSQATYVKRNVRIPFRINSNLSNYEEGLRIAGAMLYWGEGTKNGNRVSLCNSNPQIITLFLKFLRLICGVNNDKLRLILHMYDDQNEKELLGYWSKIAKIPSTQFYKVTVAKGKKGTYKKKSRYGTIEVRYYNTKLHKIILNWINSYFKRYNAGVAHW